MRNNGPFYTRVYSSATYNSINKTTHLLADLEIHNQGLVFQQEPSYLFVGVVKLKESS